MQLITGMKTYLVLVTVLFPFFSLSNDSTSVIDDWPVFDHSSHGVEMGYGRWSGYHGFNQGEAEDHDPDGLIQACVEALVEEKEMSREEAQKACESSLQTDPWLGEIDERKIDVPLWRAISTLNLAKEKGFDIGSGSLKEWMAAAGFLAALAWKYKKFANPGTAFVAALGLGPAYAATAHYPCQRDQDNWDQFFSLSLAQQYHTARFCPRLKKLLLEKTKIS